MAIAVNAVKTPIIHTAANAKLAGKVADNTPCQIQAIDTRTNQTFIRSFGSYAAMEQWLATEPSVHALDFTGAVVRPANSF